MSECINQDLSDKNITEFEKELEEVVKNVEISEETQEKSNVLETDDSLKIEEDKICEMLNDVNNYQTENSEAINVESEVYPSAIESQEINEEKNDLDNNSEKEGGNYVAILVNNVTEYTEDSFEQESNNFIQQIEPNNPKINFENHFEAEPSVTDHNHSDLQSVNQIQNVDAEENTDSNNIEEYSEVAASDSKQNDNMIVVEEFVESSPNSVNIITQNTEISVIETEEEVLNTDIIINASETSENQLVINNVEESVTLSEKDDVSLDGSEHSNSATEFDGRKIPSHVLGRNVINPSTDVTGKGRIPPKPRLGVKIPYRNLTSQIVSKDEIAEEVMERSRLRNAATEPTGDVLFARKLTQRLAHKLAVAEKKSAKIDEPNKSDKSSKVKESTSEITPKKHVPTDKTKGKEKVEDNSDLLAILEGDDDIDWREINSKEVKNKSTGQNQQESNKNVAEVEGEDAIAEPRFSSSLVTKTYTRKRKSSGDTANATSKKAITLNEKPVVQTKVNIDLAPNTYISKSSRIVKKKVIWDPDEAIPMSTFAVSKPKTDNHSEKIVSPKTVEKKVTKQEKVSSPEQKKNLKVKSTEKVVTRKNSSSPVTSETPEKNKPQEVTVKSSPTEKVQAKKITSPIKKSKQLPVKPKRLTEVDKLLMDEGAVNMLYSVKTTDEHDTVVNRPKGKKKSDNFQQELMDKTNEIKNELQMNSAKESPKSLRKKDNSIPILKRSEVVGPTGIPLARKKTKYSKNSSNSPPASPSYSYSAEASRIIRRHSSSSFSSVGSHAENVNDENKSVNGSSSSVGSKGVGKSGKHKGAVADDAIKNKKMKLVKENSNVKKLKQKDEDEKASEIKSEENLVSDENTYQTIQVTKIEKIVNIIMLSSSSSSNYLNDMILNEIITVLELLSNDNSCTAVLLSSSTKNCFSKGIDYTVLIEENEERRKEKAEKLALIVKNFLKCIVKFPKLLIASVHGDAVGLGVTMLPLFDMVFASDIASFSTPYASLGCTVEGGILLSFPNMMHNSLVGELFYASKKLSAADALKFGLVTRTFWPEKFEEELISVVKDISKNSMAGIVAIKNSLRHSLLSNVDSLLTLETNNLIRLWTNDECQSNFKLLIKSNE